MKEDPAPSTMPDIAEPADGRRIAGHGPHLRLVYSGQTVQAGDPGAGPAPGQSGDLADVVRMRDALSLAVTLLDGLIEMALPEQDREDLNDIAAVFHEAVGIAARGAAAASQAAERGEN